MYGVKALIKTSVLVGLLLLAIGLAACDSNDGPAEKAGAKIDNAVDQVTDKAEDVADELSPQGPAEKVGEAIDETVEKAKEAVQ